MSDPRALTPSVDLHPGEVVVASFLGDKTQYWREHAVLAALAVVLGMGVLWLMGNPHVWTGAVGGLAAIGVRGFYLASDELATRWDLTNQRLLGPQGRAVSLENITKLNRVFSAVQVVTLGGDKYLLKYQADRETTIARIQEAKAKR